MADESSESEDKTEEASDERREEFRQQGNVAVSREITGTFVLAAVLAFIVFYVKNLINDIKFLLLKSIENAAVLRLDTSNVTEYFTSVWMDYLMFIAPMFAVSLGVAVLVTFLQSGFNWSWKKITPDINKLNPITGLANMFNWSALGNLGKSIAKLLVVMVVAYSVLEGEWRVMPGLMRYPVELAWGYCGDIIISLFWSIIILTLAIGALDFIFSFIMLERKMRMSKQELKEEFKKREVDPHVKSRMRRMARDLSMSKMLEATKTATVVVMNPTHFAVALRYELGMAAPVVVAKGKDFNALRIKEVALQNDVTVLENPPLARLLYRSVEVGKEIPESLYKAVSEVIRYVFKLKGRNISKS